MNKSLKNSWVGQKYFYFSELNSTHVFFDDFKLTASKVAPCAIVAGFQTKGRGQASNTWQSHAGQNLLCTFYCGDWQLPVSHMFDINKMVSIALLNLIQSLGLKNVKIKWPNDILVDERKIAGILIKNSVQGQKLHQVAISIGLNVNQTSFFNFSRKATSLKIETGLSSKVLDIFAMLQTSLNEIYLNYVRDANEIHQQYLKNLLGLNQNRGFIIYNQRQNGTITNVLHDGKLQIELANNQLVTLSEKEVVFI